MDCLRASVPVYDDDGNGCYSWMAVRAGENSKFCKDVTIKGDLTVEGSYIGLPDPPPPTLSSDITCDNLLIAPANSTLDDALQVVSAYLCNKPPPPPQALQSNIECPPGNVIAPVQMPVEEALKLVSDYFCSQLSTPPPASARSIISLQLNENRQFNAGSVEPPVPLFWDQQVSISPDFAYSSATGLITVLNTGLYKFSTTLVASIETETIVETSKIQLYLTEPDASVPNQVVLINQSTFSGQDLVSAHTAEKILSITSVPFTVATAVAIRDPAPPELVQLIGAVGFTNGDGFTNVTVERLGDAQPVVDVSVPTGG